METFKEIEPSRINRRQPFSQIGPPAESWTEPIRFMCIAIVSSYMASTALERGQLVRLLNAFRIPQFWIRAQIPHSRSHLARVQALLTCLRETFDPACAWEKNMEL